MKTCLTLNVSSIFCLSLSCMKSSCTYTYIYLQVYIFSSTRAKYWEDALRNYVEVLVGNKCILQCMLKLVIPTNRTLNEGIRRKTGKKKVVFVFVFKAIWVVFQKNLCPYGCKSFFYANMAIMPSFHKYYAQLSPGNKITSIWD